MEFAKCQATSLYNVKFYDAESGADCAESKYSSDECKKKLKADAVTKYVFDDNSSKSTPIYDKILKSDNENKSTIVLLKSADKAGSRTGAVVALDNDTPNNIFGYDREDWKNRDTEKSKLKLGSNKIYDLYGAEQTGILISDFKPAYKSASDGSVVDFNNAARTKSTVIGAGAGGALGALSGAAGAESAVQERWQTAMREYDDSLNNIVCYTGARYLSRYNDVVIIPEMKNLD